MAKGVKTGGRKPGTPNKVTSEVRQVAQQFTTEAVERLAEIMRDNSNLSAAVAAANSLLDRGHGKPTQFIGGDQDAGPIFVITGVPRD
jgi:hypothetical protein